MLLWSEREPTNLQGLREPPALLLLRESDATLDFRVWAALLEKAGVAIPLELRLAAAAMYSINTV